MIKWELKVLRGANDNDELAPEKHAYYADLSQEIFGIVRDFRKYLSLWWARRQVEQTKQ